MPRLNPATCATNLLDNSILGKKDAAIAMSVLWTIRGSRNIYNHGEVRYQPWMTMELGDKSRKLLDLRTTTGRATVTSGVKWCRIEIHWIKLNG
jgi:hypothetical protein